MDRLLELLKTLLTAGREPQAFISAPWLLATLRWCPVRWKRAWALRILALSPHYFYRHAQPDYARLSRREFLEAEYARNRDTRQRICDEILRPFLRSGDTVLDYGCGAGFLARAVAPSVRRLYACDLSRGVLACARVLNAADNVGFLTADAEGLATIADGSLDLVYSIAVIQHVTDEVLETILATCARKLKPGGRLVWQVQLEGDNWRSEKDWRADESFVGRVKLRFALHCFARTAEQFTAVLERHGFSRPTIEPIANRVKEHFDDICDQHLLVSELKAAGG